MTNLELIKNYHALIWDDKDINAIDEYFHADVLVNSPVRTVVGTQQLKEVMASWHTGLPDLKVYWDDFICENDKVVARWHAEGCHTGAFLGLSPTHKKINYSGVTLYQLTNGKVSEYWAFVDMDQVKKQLMHP